MSTISRRHLLAGSMGAAASASCGKSPSAPARPNLVYVFADQLAYQHCGYAGDPHAQTPHIDRLAAQGCNARQAISNTPVCAPYRASLMTGKHQSSTGMVINELRLSPEHRCFGHVLRDASYRTAYIGKWHLWASEWGNHHLVRNGFTPPGPYRLGFDGQWAAYNFSHDYFGAPYFADRPERQTWEGYEPDAQTSMAIDFIRSSAGQSEPFALFLSWGPPHNPWTWENVAAEDAEPFRGKEIPLHANFSGTQDPYGDQWARLPANPADTIREQMRIYYAQTLSVDRNLGRLMQALDEAGAAENTILVFTSDHGEMFGSHGRAAKYIFYEEAVRVPFLVRWPGEIRAGTVSGALLGTPDIMPTLLAMMGLSAPASAEGRDLSTALRTGSSDGPEAAHLQGMGSTAAWSDGSEWRAVRDHEFTYAVYRRDGAERLFDNRKDPLQLSDLAEDRQHAATLRRYREVSEKWRHEHNDTFENCTWYRDHWTRERNIVNTATGVGHDLNQLDRIAREYLGEPIPAPSR